MSANEIYVNVYRLNGMGSIENHFFVYQHQTNCQMPYHVGDGTDEMVIALQV
jgi:hypothetical protein